MMYKFSVVLKMVCAVFLAVIGFSGGLSPILGGFGWALFGLASLTELFENEKNKVKE